MKLSKSVFYIVLLILLSGCASTKNAKVYFDKNEQINTANYKTFTWLNSSKIIAAPVGLNQVMKVRVDKAIEEAFIAKGYQLVNAKEQADFAISYSIGSRDKLKVDSFPSAFRIGFGWGHDYFGRYSIGNETQVRTYAEGKLAIDVFDMKTKQPAWHGWGVKRITSTNNGDPVATVKLVVEQVIAQFN